MIEIAGLWFAVCAGWFLFLFLFVRLEQKRGQRLVASAVRAWLDRLIECVLHWFQAKWQHFVKYILQLHWYYSLHSLLQAVLRVVVAAYHHLERAFERNRLKAKRLRAEKRRAGQQTHLEKVAQHKEETSLTPAEQKRLRKKKLEENL